MLVALLWYSTFFAGMLASIAAVPAGRWTLLLLGALLMLPFFGYLALTPRFSFLILTPVAVQMAGAVALRRGHRGLAVLLSLPTIAVVGYIVVFVLP